MKPSARPQISLTMMLALVACVAVNIWLFRVGILWGVIAVNVTKHVVIAALCQAVGLNRKPENQVDGTRQLASAIAEPSAN